MEKRDKKLDDIVNETKPETKIISYEEGEKRQAKELRDILKKL